MSTDGTYGDRTRFAHRMYFRNRPKQNYQTPVKCNSNLSVGGTGNSKTATRANYYNREAAKSGLLDVSGFAVDSAIEDVGTAFGKKIISPLGTAASGVLTGMDVSATLNNKNYTTGQKITKVTVQVLGGGITVVFGTVIGEIAVGVAVPTGGASIIVGAVVIGGFTYGVSRLQNWAYGKLDLD